jgi:hypothetical protein
MEMLAKGRPLPLSPKDVGALWLPTHDSERGCAGFGGFHSQAKPRGRVLTLATGGMEPLKGSVSLDTAFLETEQGGIHTRNVKIPSAAPLEHDARNRSSLAMVIEAFPTTEGISTEHFLARDKVRRAEIVRIPSGTVEVSCQLRFASGNLRRFNLLLCIHI